MHRTQTSMGLVLLALALSGNDPGGTAAFAQNSPTLGVPHKGRVVSVVEFPNATHVSFATPDSSSPGPTLGIPQKPSKIASAPTLSGDFRTPFSASDGLVKCAAERGQSDLSASVEPMEPVPWASSPMVVRGSVDENYLSGVPGRTSASEWRGGLSAPWDWLQRTVHDSGVGQYCEWFHIKTTFQSDHAFDEFISPVTNPFFFEDPRALTELRPVFIFQNTPKGNPLFAGGNIEMFALQARLALNERLSIVMPKLGFIAFQPDAPSPLKDEIGFAEIIVGPKLTFWRDDASNILAAFGVNFEIAAGGGNVFQSTGSGSVVPYLTFGKELLDNLHFLGAIGYRASFDSDRSESFFVSLHADYEFYRIIYPFLEVNWFHYTSGGKVLAANFEGGDLFNFGSTGASGEDIVTMGVGGRVKILGDRLQAGAAFEFPLTKGKDILDWRLTLDLIWRY